MGERRDRTEEVTLPDEEYACSETEYYGEDVRCRDDHAGKET